MGYKRKPKSVAIKGVKTDDILKMDVSRMGLSDLRALTSRLTSTARKRIDRLANSSWGKSSHAFKEWEASGSKVFSTKGAKTIQDVQKEFKRVKEFLTQETSSLEKFAKFREKIENTINNKMGLSGENEFHFKDSQEYDKFWETYHKVEEEKKWLKNNKSTSPILAQVIMNEMTLSGETPNFHNIIERMNKVYEAREINLNKIEQDDFAQIFENIDNNDDITSIDELL